MVEPVRIENLGSPEALVEVESGLREAEHAGHGVELDLTPLARPGSRHRRCDITTVALLANLLLGRFKNLSVLVEWPVDDSIVGQLERGGLAFSLVQREGDTWYPNAVPQFVDVWRAAWRPRGETLLPSPAPEYLQEETFVYINTHLLGRGHFRSYGQSAALPWLGMIPVPRQPASRGERNSFVRYTERAIVEILENLPEHAFDPKGEIVRRDEWLTIPEIDGRSVLICSLTRGGTDSFDRLHLLALDNGFGIGRTLRWQHPQLDWAVADLLQTVLRNELQKRSIAGHNGIGLWWLNDIARKYGGEVELVTENDSDSSGCRAVSVVSDYEDVDTSRSPQSRILDLSMRGTIVRATLLVPRATGEEWLRPLMTRKRENAPSTAEFA